MIIQEPEKLVSVNFFVLTKVKLVPDDVNLLHILFNSEVNVLAGLILLSLVDGDILFAQFLNRSLNVLSMERVLEVLVEVKYHLVHFEEFEKGIQ